jgi:hypothetical protein
MYYGAELNAILTLHEPGRAPYEFRRLACALLPDSRIERISAEVESLERLRDVRDPVQHLTP